MLEHVSGLYMKLQFEQNKLRESEENSMCFTNDFQMKNLIITKYIGRLACQWCNIATACSDIAPLTREATWNFCNN